MSYSPYAAIFDGHNDMLLRLHELPADEALALFVNGRDDGHLDLPRMQAGGFMGGLFAVFVPSGGTGRTKDNRLGQAAYDNPLPASLPQAQALPVVLSMVSLLHRLAAASGGRFRVCRSVADIRRAMGDNAVAGVLHFEGAEAIDTDLRALDVFVEAGLRSIGPVWSRPTAFGHGVPFRYPASPDTGDGLTAAGKALVHYCNQHRLTIDLSHLNEKGFWDIARLSHAPLVASHSNAHVVCPHARNLTDNQLRAVRDSGGIVGLNFAVPFLRPDGRDIDDTGLDVMLSHLDHMLEIMGPDHVGIGSDFDGAWVPRAIGDASGLPVLQSAMHAHGYTADLMQKISHGNWLRVLEATWGS